MNLIGVINLILYKLRTRIRGEWGNREWKKFDIKVTPSKGENCEENNDDDEFDMRK